MCIKLNSKLWRDYTISFFAGLMASLVIVFALNQEKSLIKGWFLFAIVVTYFIGIGIVELITSMIKSERE